MEKLLTISIAAYNVENYLEDTLRSLCVPEVMDKLEVLIENDGSKDKTAEIAEKYVKKYPETFQLINKENGGYGTTVNNSMELATGKYFKLLDGDDWFDKEGLISLIHVLENSESEWILSRYYIVKDGSFEKNCDEPVWKEYEGQTVNIEDVKCDMLAGIWQTTVRTSVLKEHRFTLPSHRLYTDQLFIVYSMPFVNKITFLKDPVYCYRVGREGQSVSKENRIRHCDEAMANLYTMIDFYADNPAINDKNRGALLSRISFYYFGAFRTQLLKPYSTDTYYEIRKLETYTKKKSPDIYRHAGEHRKRIKVIRIFGKAGYKLQAGKISNWA